MEKELLLSEAWNQESERWAKWAREPGHDSYWRFHRDQFMQLVPPPGILTVDIGCGEGRVARDLKLLGHRVVGVDVCPGLVKLAQESDPQGEYLLANAAAIPLDSNYADVAIAFMSPQDIDDIDSAFAEASRILIPGGHLVLAIVHPINSSGRFTNEDEDSEFVIAGSYLDEFRYSDNLTRDGLEMTFHSQHRPLERYSRALEKSGFLMEAIREHPVPDGADHSLRTRRWRRLPLFMHIRALKR
jgi:ubiquinone/menaquinone biosynthesis C-methylase UbiE